MCYYFSTSLIIAHLSSAPIKIWIGYAHLAILQSINDHYLRPGQDFFGQFDLIAGTSVGGVESLMISVDSNGEQDL